MVRRTFGSIKSELARVAGAAGQSMADDQIMAYVNVATEELMQEHDWPSVIDRLRFNVTTGRITLPTEYERIMMMTIDRVPMQMQSPWFEFVGYGLDLAQPAPTPDTQIDFLRDVQGVLDREECATFADVPTDTTYALRVYGERDERVCGQRPNISILGYDAEDIWIRAATGNSYVCATGNGASTGNGAQPNNYDDGINIPINGDTDPYFIQTTQTAKSITAISKPVTRGNVYLYAVPVAGGTPFHLGTYAPRDTTPSYRRYQIPGLRDGVTYHIVARCRRRFTPIVQDTDFLLISNLPALKSMIMAVYYLEAADAEKYAAYKSIAVDILKKETKAYIGLQRTKPIITVSENTGVRADGMYIL